MDIVYNIGMVNDDCWLYAEVISTNGYGVISHNSYIYYAHRLMYQAFRGEIPKGLVIDHLCHNRACVNPAHLEPVSNGENLKRGIGIGSVNRYKSHCSNGHEFTSDNTYQRKTGGRICKTCNVVWRRNNRHKSKLLTHD